jgi:hypothetical protein
MGAFEAILPRMYDVRTLKFDWGPKKAVANLRKHGVSFDEPPTWSAQGKQDSA